VQTVVASSQNYLDEACYKLEYGIRQPMFIYFGSFVTGDVKNVLVFERPTSTPGG